MKKWIIVFLSVVLGANCIFTETSRADEQKYVLYTVRPITNKKILPDSNTIAGKISNEIELAIEEKLNCEMKIAPDNQLGKVKRYDDAPGRYVEFCKSTFEFFWGVEFDFDFEIKT